MRCGDCKKWLVESSTRYEDGSVIVNFKPLEGFGRCRVLAMDTQREFGCNKFEAGGPEIELTLKTGAPWQYSIAGTCPDCNGTGCRRCAHTGKVRHYEDGHVGEEQTRLHPKEKEQIEAVKAAAKRIEAEEMSKLGMSELRTPALEQGTGITSVKGGKASIMEQT